jgi:hypothetical protein
VGGNGGGSVRASRNPVAGAAKVSGGSCAPPPQLCCRSPPHRRPRPTIAPKQSEAFSRVLIDQALTDGGWDLLDSHQVRLELHGPGGRVDYVLLDPLGRALCVLEAKREDHDPYDAKEQARSYAESLSAPFVLLSNGWVHWFWNYQRSTEGAPQQDAYRIERLPSPEDLDRLRLKNLQPPRPLLSESIGPDSLKPFKSGLTLRSYQIRTLDEVDGHRAFARDLGQELRERGILNPEPRNKQETHPTQTPRVLSRRPRVRGPRH